MYFYFLESRKKSHLLLTTLCNSYIAPCIMCVCVCDSFIRLADYLIINMLHMLTVNSITTMLTAFTAQLQTTPSILTIQAWTSVLDEIPEVLELEDRVCRLFDDLTRFSTSPDQLQLGVV